ncbi:MAG: hypothetical protein M3Y56_00055, partial [Armatimonadota bacterium]|nr:hypothetical protein [Armatimonadota bacterium]
MDSQGKGRLLRCAGSAAWNMALDESLLNSTQPDSPVVLRLYGWNRPAVTLGRFQDAARAVDWELCRRKGIEVVRRPTGGRAVYHDTDLTFTLLFPEAAGGGHSIRESYGLVANALSRSFCRFGLDIQQGDPDRESVSSRSDCFAHVSLA